MLSQLSCNAANCVNNVGGLCTARVIHVAGKQASSSPETDCNTFGERTLGNAVKNIANMNIGGEIIQAFNSEEIKMSPEIVCDAVKCIHNSHRNCKASNVQIFGPEAMSNLNTQCETFKPF